MNNINCITAFNVSSPLSSHPMFFILAIVSALLITNIIVPNYIKLKSKKEKSQALLLKAFGTSIAVAFAIVGVILSPSTHTMLILLGLLFGLAGDILLEIYIPLGGIAFFLGNSIYIYSMLLIQPLKIINLIFFLIILLIVIISFGSDLKKSGKYRFLFLLYAIVVAAMAAIAIPYLQPKVLITPHTGMIYILLGLGTFLFSVSDYLLAYRILHVPTAYFHRISLTVYYLAQLCIALSTLG